MIANPAIALPAAVPHRFTLNELRGHGPIADEPSFTSTLAPSRLALAAFLAAFLAIGAFIWVDPLNLFTPTEASPAAPAFVPSAEPARPIERQEIIASPTPVPATKSVEVPIAPAPVVQAPHAPALAVRPRASSIPKEKTAPPVLLNTPEEKTAAPIVQELGDDTKNAPKPAATSDPAPVTE